jgi:hypothetical protein
LKDLEARWARTGDPEALAKSRRAFQRTIRTKIKERDPHDSHTRIRTNLDRWKLPGLPRTTADKFADQLTQLKRLAPPRVAAAVFGTDWNRWCTFRRFQQRNNPLNTCKVGCGGEAEDSIEHYSRCKILRKLHKDELGLEADWLLPLWLGLGGRNGEEKMNSNLQHFSGALGAYAAYRTTNLARHSQGLTAAGAAQAFRQALLEGTAGHATATKMLHQLRSRSRPPQGAGSASERPNKQRRLTIQQAYAAW